MTRLEPTLTTLTRSETMTQPRGLRATPLIGRLATVTLTLLVASTLSLMAWSAPGDVDDDGVPDADDNCVAIYNPPQVDSDGDGSGDVCDPDDDDDGHLDEDDNCPVTPNPFQEDSDNNGLGDACSYTPAGQCLTYDYHLAPDASVQADVSGVCVGCVVENPENVIDADLENFASMDSSVGLSPVFTITVGLGDTVQGGHIAGFALSTPSSLLGAAALPSLTIRTYLNGQPQESSSGNLLDLDVLEAASNLTLVSFETTEAFDTLELEWDAGLVDAFDELRAHFAVTQAPMCDSDGDGLEDNEDNCPLDANPNQEDADNDGSGDACDPDDDGDGTADDTDNCPNDTNPNQSDDDGDGVDNDCDNCPASANVAQADGDGECTADVCDS